MQQAGDENSGRQACKQGEFYFHARFCSTSFSPQQVKTSETVVLPLGKVVPPLGTVIPPLGTVIPPLGTVIPSLGKVVPSLGKAFPPAGNAFSSQGNRFPSAGNAFPPRGNAFPPQLNRSKPARNEGFSHQTAKPGIFWPQRKGQSDSLGCRVGPVARNRRTAPIYTLPSLPTSLLPRHAAAGSLGTAGQMRIMKVPAPVQELLAAKRSGVALLVFVAGLLALPAAFTAGSIYHRAGEPISWRPALDYFEWLAATLGLLCCIIAPFLPKISRMRKIFLCVAAVCIYILDFACSLIASMIVFGPSF